LGELNLKVLITGANGFIGKNLSAALATREGFTILRYDINDSWENLRQYVRIADFVVHLAGVNRPQDPSEFFTGNKGFTEQLLSLLEEEKRVIPFWMSSSIQAELDNPYGLSKRQAEEAVFNWARRTGAQAFVYRLPNVYGKWCRPNYNSVVATFCHNIARGLPIRIDDPDRELTLVYIDDVVEEIINAIEGKPLARLEGPSAGEGRFFTVKRTSRITVGRLAELIRSFADSRRNLIVPNFEGYLERTLYATFLSYLDESDFGYPLLMKEDQRGWLAEFIKSRQFGQIFISRTKPGVTRGNHWHHTKVEKFLVVQGEAIIRFRQIHGDKVIEYPVSGRELKVLDIPPGYTHSITNVGDEDVITLFWADEIFDPDRPDTFFMEV